MSFANLKKNSKQTLQELAEKLQNVDKRGSSDDNRFWKLTVDKANNGSAVIRFLPPKEGESDPFIKVWDHFFKGPGGTYAEKSLTTIGLDDPVSELNSRDWNSGSEENKEKARKRKRQTSFISNIYVESDPANTENEGKVFLFQYGKKIFDKIMDVMNPSFAGDDPINPFDFWEGASFKLRAHDADGGFRSYEKSAFAAPKPLHSDDKVLESIYDQLYSLQDLIAPSKFKSYDELQAKLNKVLGLTGNGQSNDAPSQSPREPGKTAPAAQLKSSPMIDDDDDDDLAAIRKLIESDD